MRRESWEFRQKGYSIHIKNIPNGCIVNIFLFLYAACLQKKKFIYSSYCEFVFAKHEKKFFIPLVTLKKIEKRGWKDARSY